MVQNDSQYLLDDILAEWHKWANGYRYAGDVGSSAIFREAKSSRGWDSISDIVDEEIDCKRHEGVEFAINGDKRGQGAMPEPYRTAVMFNAKNLATGHHVWRSPRLPADAKERAVLLVEARAILLDRLMLAGIV